MTRKSKASSQESKCFYCLLLTTYCLLFFTGCASKHEEIKPSAGYFEIVNQMTKNTRVTEGLESRLFIHATYKSWPLREAYVEEYAKRYQMDETQKERLKETEKDADERFNEFFIAAYTPDVKWNDFDQPLSIWKIYMEDEKGNRLTPIEITKVDVGSPLIREFYPYLDLWSLGYRIKFPKFTATGERPFPEEGKGYFKLIVTGILGSAQMEWMLK